MILNNFKKRLFTSLILFFLVLLIFHIKFLFIYSIIVLSVLSILEFLNLTKRFIKKNFYLTLINILFLIFLIFFDLILVFFYDYFPLKIILFSLLLCCIASDIGGYFFGKTFKGPKLSKISPNKTIIGAFGSLILSTLVIISIFNFLSIAVTYKLFLIAILTSISCQIGDLFFSFLKRKAKIKDTGNFFPGHGGVLDRLDGIFFGIPIGILLIIYFF